MTYRGKTVGNGVRSFFLWDQVFEFPIVILVMMLELRIAAVSRGSLFSLPKLLGLSVLITLVAGPGSASLALSWLRDEILFLSGS